jgi:hypothetical protein
MKKYNLLLTVTALLTAALSAYSQQGNRTNIFDKANNSVTKVSNIIAVFQPYLLKARQLYYDGKQLAGDIKNSAKKGGSNNSNNSGQYNNTGNSGSSYNSGSQGYNSSSDPNYSSNNSGYGSSNQNQSNNSGYSSSNQNQSNNQGYSSSNQGGAGYNSNAGNAQSYLAGQSLPINNPSSVNNDATGNWGNQNNGLYGNCLDVATGTIMGMGDAAQTPTSVDLMFFAPADGQNTYYLMTPGFAKSNSTAEYMTEHTSSQVMQWSDVNESEVALTKLTIGQFNQIQNNGQIQSAVRNAQGYAGYYASVGQKLDGQVFGVKMQMDNREVYALVAVIKQMGTSGSSGYLKIKIKTTGLATSNGQVDANAYQRQ